MTTPTNDQTTTSAQERLRGTAPFLVMYNTRVEGCGIPPIFDHEHFLRTSFAYLENEYGEEMVLTFDRESQTCKLYHADYSWEKPAMVVDGAAHGITLHEGEQMWIVACYAEWTRQPFLEVLKKALTHYEQATHRSKEFVDWFYKTHPGHDMLKPGAQAQFKQGYLEWCKMRGIEPDEDEVPVTDDEK